MKKKERKRLPDASLVAVVCLVIHFVAQKVDDFPLSRVAMVQLEKVRRWNGEVLHDFGITSQKDSRQTADALTGHREQRRTSAMRYLVRTWETLTLMLSTGEDEAAVEGTQIYTEVI